jgi:hypothetical protein
VVLNHSDFFNSKWRFVSFFLFDLLRDMFSSNYLASITATHVFCPKSNGLSPT